MLEPDDAPKERPLAARENWSATLRVLGCDAHEVGILIVDHGSRVATSNDLLLAFAEQFVRESPAAIVEAAHMELAEPSIATGLARCVKRGARVVVVSPFFLLPGRHWNEDIPNLVAEAAREHPGLQWFLAAPLGLHPLLPEILLQRIERCGERQAQPDATCDVCEHGPRRCGLR